MSGNQIQPAGRSADVDSMQDALPSQDWGEGQDAPQAPSGPNLERYVAALNRFKWLILLFMLLGGGAGYSATKFVEPEFEVSATIMMALAEPRRT